MTANSRLLTNDTRQNVVLNRQFFSDLLTLSFTRYRKITQCEFDKRLFLKNQATKAQASMPGLLPYTDQFSVNGNRLTSSGIPSSRQVTNPLSSSSILFPLGSKSDPTFDRKKPLFNRPMRAGPIPMKSERDTITDISFSKSRPPTQHQLTRERLNRLAQPKGSRFRSLRHNHTRSIVSGSAMTPEDLFGRIDHAPHLAEASVVGSIPDKSKNAAEDQRFHDLIDAFSTVHEPQTSSTQTVKSIVEANPSLQDDEGQWKQTDLSLINRKNEMKHHRQMLLQKLHSRIDIFLIDVGA